MAFKRVLSENALGHIGNSWATSVGKLTTLVPFAQNWSLGYESDLKQGCWTQWPQLYHPQMARVSKIMSSGPQLGSQGYPRKVTLRRMAQLISVRYERALNQGSQILRTLFWTLLPPEGDKVEAIGFRNLVLGHFHTPNFNFGQRNQSCWPSNLCCSAAAYMALSIFTQYAF